MARQRGERLEREKEEAPVTLIQKSVTITAPADTVLAILEDPERQSELEGKPEPAHAPPFSAWVL